MKFYKSVGNWFALTLNSAGNQFAVTFYPVYKSVILQPFYEFVIITVFLLCPNTNL